MDSYFYILLCRETRPFQRYQRFIFLQIKSPKAGKMHIHCKKKHRIKSNAQEYLPSSVSNIPESSSSSSSSSPGSRTFMERIPLGGKPSLWRRRVISCNVRRFKSKMGMGSSATTSSLVSESSGGTNAQTPGRIRPSSRRRLTISSSVCWLGFCEYVVSS